MGVFLLVLHVIYDLVWKHVVLLMLACLSNVITVHNVVINVLHLSTIDIVVIFHRYNVLDLEIVDQMLLLVVLWYLSCITGIIFIIIILLLLYIIEFFWT